VVDKSIDPVLLAQTAFEVTLYITKDSLEIPTKTLGDSYSENWDQDEDAINIQAGINMYDSTWQSGTVGLPVEGGDIYHPLA
jgi:hypothetical protein